MASHAVKILLALTATVISVIHTADALNVARNTTTTFTCRGRVPYPAWYLDETVPILPPLYTVGYESITGEYLGVLVIDGNKSGGTLNLSCEVASQTAYTTRLTIEGPLPSPENVTLSSQNSSTQLLQWKPPYYTLNQESDIIQVDPNITHYTVYTTDVQHTRRIIGRVEKTETSFTLSNIHNEDPCPMYQVSAWNAGGEGELSEPVQESTPQVPNSILAENISLTLEPSVVHIHIDVDATCVSRMPEFFLITLMTSTGETLIELNMTHELGMENADFNISLESLPKYVDICTTVVRISAGNSAGMSSLSEAFEVVCSGGSTEFQTTAVSTTTSTISEGTESGNRQQDGSATLIAISTGVIAAIGGALIAILIIVCRKYKKRHGKGHVDNDYSESPSLGGPVPLYQPPAAAADLVNSEQTTGSRVGRDSESTTVWTQSSDTFITPPSTDSEGSDDHLLEPSPPASVGSPHLVYAQLEAVTQTQVQPPANDDPVQYAQIEHQD